MTDQCAACGKTLARLVFQEDETPKRICRQLRCAHCDTVILTTYQHRGTIGQELSMEHIMDALKDRRFWTPPHD